MTRRSTISGQPGAQAVARALAILKTFTDERPIRSLAEVAAELRLNKTTTHRLFVALEAEGMVAREETAGTYRLGPEVIALGTRALRSMSLRDAARAELERLARETGETATIEVLVNDETLIVDEVHGRHLLGATPAVGTRWPAHATSTGKVLLAFAGPDATRNGSRRNRGNAAGLARLTSSTITTPADFARELADVRAQGYAVNREELELGFVALGAPIWNHEERAVAALSLGGPVGRMIPARIAALAEDVQRAAAKISQRLGSRHTRARG